MPRGYFLSISLTFAGLLTTGETKSGSAEPLRCTIECAGVEREYFVRLPANYRPGTVYWLVITVHGGGGNGRTHFLSTDVRRAADKIGLNAIVVSPSFSNTDFQASRFPVLGEGQFLLSVIEALKRSYRLHPKVLLTGYSRGGQFSHRFAFQYPKLVEAVAPFSAGTWTTPGGALLIESLGKVDNPKAFLLDRENRESVPRRLHDLFSCRVAAIAGSRPRPAATATPFLVMCGSLDTRHEIAKQFAKSLARAGYRVETEWPRTPHGARDKEAFRGEFKKYAQRAVEFFQRTIEQ